MHKQRNITAYIIVSIMIAYLLQVSYVKMHPRPSIAVLGYHHIIPDDDKAQFYPHSMWVNTLSSFKDQMQYLYDHGYQALDLDTFYDWQQGKRELDGKYVVITFDDGFLSNNLFAEPVLQNYGFTGSVFVIGSQIADQSETYNPSIRQHASMDDMKQDTILSFYAHSYDLHKKEPKAMVQMLDKAQLREDTELMAALLPITYYAYPYGQYNGNIQEVLKESGVRMAFSYNENRKATRDDDLYAIPRFNVNAYTRLDVFIQMMNF